MGSESGERNESCMCERVWYVCQWNGSTLFSLPIKCSTLSVDRYPLTVATIGMANETCRRRWAHDGMKKATDVHCVKM